jgi:hypothetical protein
VRIKGKAAAPSATVSAATADKRLAAHRLD